MSSAPPVPPRIPGDAQDLSITQGNFSAIANAAGWVRNQLLNASGQVVWSGAAHDAFQSVLKDVPYDLQKIQASFSQAASALQGYLRQLPDLQSSYDRVHGQYVSLWDHQQQLSNQLSNSTPGFLGGSPSAQQQAEMHSLQSQINGNQPELDRLYRNLSDLYGQAKQAASSLATALGHASTAGIQDDWGNRWSRYSGDVAGFVGGVVSGIVHDVEELVAAVVNLGATLVKMADDIAHGNWQAVGKDADQALLDINDICRSLSNILMTLTPILQLIPGIGEIVDVLDVVMLAASMIEVASDVGMMAAGGTAEDPLSVLEGHAQTVSLSEAGGENILWDSVGLVFSLVPGGGGVVDDSAHDAETDALEEWQKGASLNQLQTSRDVAKFWNQDTSAFDSLIKWKQVAAESSFKDILHYRTYLKDVSARADAIKEIQPQVTLVNVWGRKIATTFATYQGITRFAGPITHGAMLGHDVYKVANGPSSDDDVSAADDTAGTALNAAQQ